MDQPKAEELVLSSHLGNPTFIAASAPASAPYPEPRPYHKSTPPGFIEVMITKVIVRFALREEVRGDWRSCPCITYFGLCISSFSSYHAPYFTDVCQAAPQWEADVSHAQQCGWLEVQVQRHRRK